MAININPAHKGLLKKSLKVKSGDKIPVSKLKKATHSSSALEKKRAVFAMNASKWHHK